MKLTGSRTKLASNSRYDVYHYLKGLDARNIHTTEESRAMQTQMGVLLGLLWVQTCCELRTSQRELEEISQLTLERSKRGKEKWRKRENTSLLGCVLYHADGG